MVFFHFPNHFIDPDAQNSTNTTNSPTYSYTGTPYSTTTLPYPPLISSQAPTTTTMTDSPDNLPTLTEPFPPLLPAPSNLQIRFQDQDATHSTLDAALSLKEEEEGLPPLLDEGRMVAKGRYEALEEEDELSVRQARKALDEFVRNKTPYAVLASQRLQAVVGEKNSLGFELPQVPLNMTPLFGRIASTTSGPPNLSVGNANDRRKDSGIYLPQQRSPLSPISPFPFGQVDEKTGKGLREWLLSRGKETGTQRKRECRSISFHDFTPDMRTGTHSNVLVAHYNGGGLHERADVYEVDLPTTYTDPKTQLPTQGTQTWLWFLISRPVLTISSTETNTNPFPTTDAWSIIDNNPAIPPGTIRPPPDFPMPIPTSYVVFACPASNVTEYPDCKDDSAPPDPQSPSTSYIYSLAPSYRSSNSNAHPLYSSNSNTRTRSTSSAKKFYKRKDYDFSFQGTPLFEFSSATLFSTPSQPRHEILSIDALGSWYPSDSFGLCDLAEYQARLRAWDDEVENLSREERKEDDRAYRDRSAEEPHARKGVWWEKFYEGVYREEGRWRRIRECMSRGKCRIVVRWVESEMSPPSLSGSTFQARNRSKKTSPNLGFSSDDADGDSDMSEGAGDALGLGLGIGLGVRLNGNSGNRGDGKKIKERLAGRRAVSGPARVTRSEARRRSGLGVFSTSQETVVGSGVLIGVGNSAEEVRGGQRGGAGLDVGGSKKNATAGAGSGGEGSGYLKDKRRKK
ncbi:hypothetical protein BKA65DRAFT_585886 [Rhexocercosporidium sp. MPI-PUGE-AT-0058]|nr:hypothetical protein BKA65DRAFT_585886 [Rhexocercosporidium sp. MPI-PUGE-AT-0058]